MSTRISAGVDDCPFFFTFVIMIPIDCKMTKFFLYLFVCFFGSNYNKIGELTRAASKERMVTNIIFLLMPHPLINEKFLS